LSPLSGILLPLLPVRCAPPEGVCVFALFFVFFFFAFARQILVSATAPVPFLFLRGGRRASPFLETFTSLTWADQSWDALPTIWAGLKLLLLFFPGDISIYAFFLPKYA